MTCNATYFTRDGTPSHRSLPVRQLAVNFSLGDEIVYSSSKQFISVNNYHIRLNVAFIIQGQYIILEKNLMKM